MLISGMPKFKARQKSDKPGAPRKGSRDFSRSNSSRDSSSRDGERSGDRARYSDKSGGRSFSRTPSSKPGFKRRDERTERRPRDGGRREREQPQSLLVHVVESETGLVRATRRDLASIDFVLPHTEKHDDGTILRVKPGRRPRFGATPVEVLEVVAPNSIGMESALALDNFGIPIEFPTEALDECEALPEQITLGDRTDLRDLPIVTIDGSDAKDFDDAVFAEVWMDSGRAMGWHLVVAIADVAHYVTPHSELDKAAAWRGNSVYFPDRVVPMLPEKLSNGLCSLRPKEDRPVLAVHLYIDKQGRLKHFNFVRALIHSAARLTYEQVQAHFDGEDAGIAKSLVTPLGHLKDAAVALIEARERRFALDLDLPETRLEISDNGTVEKIAQRARLFAHRLIEEFMITANVAAARQLAKSGEAALYRVHGVPTPEKIQTLKQILKQHALPFSGARQPQVADFARTIEKAHAHPMGELLMRSILQSQQQALYDPENIGHYGLALSHYTHFTSPIRRYADLLVHRALIATLKLGKDGAIAEKRDLERTAKQINLTERRAQKAEWEARDRFIATFYKDKVGETFEANVISVQKFGCFVRAEGVAEGLLPLRLLGEEPFNYNEVTLKLKGQKTGTMYQVGMALQVRLLSCDIITGQLTFALAD